MRTQVIDITPAREHLEYKARVAERKLFASSLCVEAERLLRGIIAEYTGDENVCRAIELNLLNRLSADSVLIAHMAELEMLPVSEDAWQQRLSAWLRGVHQYLPEVVREELPELGTISILDLKAQQLKAASKSGRER
jgi:hypothetical protein